MNEKEFCYWLKGFFELSNTTTLSETQIEIIKNHLDLVFENKTQSDKLWEEARKTLQHPTYSTTRYC